MSQSLLESTAKHAPCNVKHELLIARGQHVSHVGLPDSATWTIGRNPDVEVPLPSSTVSRRHARLHVGDTGCSIEDLGSENGTWVGGERIASGHARPLRLGDAVTIGECTLVLRACSQSAPYRVLNAEYMAVRLAEQCERARRDGSRFFVLGVYLEGAPAARVEPLLAAELRASDILGREGARSWSILLGDADEAEACGLAAHLTQRLNQVAPEGSTAVVGYPRDGTSAPALLAQLRDALRAPAPTAGERQLVLCSPLMLDVYRELEVVAAAPVNLLILGETGAGKDLAARHVHELSPRRDRPFVRINCAALVDTLVESELFGHEKGAFTGASHSHAGLLRSAAGGSVFLDEVGELSPRAQAKLLQVLESKQLLAVGSVRPSNLDVRFIAATHRDLQAEALAGTFRSDLYYRLAGFTVTVPPLRERREDILPLAHEMLRRCDEGSGASAPRIRDDAAMFLLDYAWPGNVRELANVMQRARILSRGHGIGPEHLPLESMRAVVLVPRTVSSPAAPDDAPTPLELTAAEADERERIIAALMRCSGNQSRAAELLGISRGTFINRLDVYRISRPRKRR